jgi:hypothetical protein
VRLARLRLRIKEDEMDDTVKVNPRVRSSDVTVTVGEMRDFADSTGYLVDFIERLQGSSVPMLKAIAHRNVNTLGCLKTFGAELTQILEWVEEQHG